MGQISVGDFAVCLPANLPLGANIHAQGFQADLGDFSTHTSAGYAITTSLPCGRRG